MTAFNRVPDDLSELLVGATITQIIPGEVGPQIALQGDGWTATLEIWRDEEGNGPGYLAVTDVTETPRFTRIHQSRSLLQSEIDHPGYSRKVQSLCGPCGTGSCHNEGRCTTCGGPWSPRPIPRDNPVNI